jgi:hypothetical protein
MRPMRRILAWPIALLVVAVGSAACGGSDGGTTGSVGMGATTSAPSTTAVPVTAAPTTPPPTTAPPTTAAPPLSGSSRLRIDGLGPIDIGMTVVQARAAAGVELAAETTPHCTILTPRTPEGVAFIVTTPASGRIELIIVKSGPIATLSGIRVGSTEEQVMAAYPGRIRVVNPTLPVHRLIYEASDPAFADRVVVFVIDSGRVASMYSGLRNHAEADEICS